MKTLLEYFQSYIDKGYILTFKLVPSMTTVCSTICGDNSGIVNVEYTFGMNVFFYLQPYFYDELTQALNDYYMQEYIK